MSAQSNDCLAKTGHAFKRCRSRKVKCVPHSQTGICLNCERSGATCEWAPRNPRIRKERLSSKARIAALESTLEQFISRQAAATEHSCTQASLDRGESSTSASRQEVDSIATKLNLLAQGNSLSDSNVSLMDILSQYNVTPEDAERYLSQFREMTLHFPFVVLPAGSTLSSLSEQSPMRLLAAVTAASSSNKREQTLLERTLRLSLLERIMLHGEKSLDLLGALLVYLAWYQFYCIPGKEASTQLIQIAIGMCHDLGLHLKPEEATTVRVGLELQHYRKVEERDGEDDEFFSSDARLLLLGCYYMSRR